MHDFHLVFDTPYMPFATKFNISSIVMQIILNSNSFLH
jgi:hypothetical protein